MKPFSSGDTVAMVKFELGGDTNESVDGSTKFVSKHALDFQVLVVSTFSRIFI
jgi:hypothetical protein